MCPPLCPSAVLKVNDKELMLSPTAQVVYGVELSKDRTGVTAKTTSSNYTVSVVFDGYTALIHMTGTVLIGNP